MKTIQVNGRDIRVQHTVVSDEKTHRVSIRVDLSHEQSGKKISHVMTIGGEGEAPVGLNKESLQVSLNQFKQRHAEIFAGNLHAAELASALEE
jgi:hypothetical protein